MGNFDFLKATSLFFFKSNRLISSKNNMMKISKRIKFGESTAECTIINSHIKNLHKSFFVFKEGQKFKADNLTIVIL